MGFPAREALSRLPGGDLSQASGALREVLTGGVAFHNSHLDREEKQIIEEEFWRPDSGLRVIVATTTLAMGVNTPASSIVIAGLMHPGGSALCTKILSVAPDDLDLLNMARLILSP